MLWKKLLKIIGILLAVFVLLELLTICAVELMTRPIKLKRTEDCENLIYKYTGITLPEQAQFATGRQYPGRDSSFIFIFKLEAPPQSGEAAIEAYVRAQFGLEDLSKYESVSPIDTSLYTSQFQELGYSFTHVIEYSQVVFSEICYGEQDDAVYVAIAFSDT